MTIYIALFHSLSAIKKKNLECGSNFHCLCSYFFPPDYHYDFFWDIETKKDIYKDYKAVVIHCKCLRADKDSGRHLTTAYLGEQKYCNFEMCSLNYSENISNREQDSVQGQLFPLFQVCCNLQCFCPDICRLPP